MIDSWAGGQLAEILNQRVLRAVGVVGNVGDEGWKQTNRLSQVTCNALVCLGSKKRIGRMTPMKKATKKGAPKSAELLAFDEAKKVVDTYESVRRCLEDVLTNIESEKPDWAWSKVHHAKCTQILADLRNLRSDASSQIADSARLKHTRTLFSDHKGDAKGLIEVLGGVRKSMQAKLPEAQEFQARMQKYYSFENMSAAEKAQPKAKSKSESSTKRPRTSSR